MPWQNKRPIPPDGGTGSSSHRDDKTLIEPIGTAKIRIIFLPTIHGFGLASLAFDEKRRKERRKTYSTKKKKRNTQSKMVVFFRFIDSVCVCVCFRPSPSFAAVIQFPFNLGNSDRKRQDKKARRF